MTTLYAPFSPFASALMVDVESLRFLLVESGGGSFGSVDRARACLVGVLDACVSDHLFFLCELSRSESIDCLPGVANG